MKPEIKSIEMKEKILTTEIVIKDTVKKQKLKLGFSLTLPKDFKDKFIGTTYKSSTGILKVNIQKDIYGKINENNNFNPKLTSKCDGEIYQPLSYKSLYYQKFKWQLWQWNWCDGEIKLNYQG
jgi:hypothetical protein